MTEGTIAPDFTIKDRYGKPLKLSDYRGKVIVLDFWATWCGPCMEAMPHTLDRAKRWAKQNVIVLAVNVWDEERSFQRWLSRHPEFNLLTFAIDPTKNNKDIASALYKVSGIPTQYIVGKDGKVVIGLSGAGGSYDLMLENALQKAVQQKVMGRP